MLRAVRIVAFLLIGVALGVGINTLIRQNTMDSGIEEEVEVTGLKGGLKGLEAPVATVTKEETTISSHASSNAIGGPFTMVNQDGETVTEADFAGQYKLMFFGFTYCPAICPTELNKVARVLDILGEEKAAKITPIFVSVDPERDDVETMKQYVEQFHPRLVGLTGSVEQVEAMKKQYKVFSKKVEMEMMDEYMVDHSSFLYLMGPDDKNLGIYPSTDTPDEIAADIEGRL